MTQICVFTVILKIKYIPQRPIHKQNDFSVFLKNKKKRIRITYRILPTYWDTSTPYHTGPKLRINSFYYLIVSLKTVWQTVDPEQIRAKAYNVEASVTDVTDDTEVYVQVATVLCNLQKYALFVWVFTH